MEICRDVSEMKQAGEGRTHLHFMTSVRTGH